MTSPLFGPASTPRAGAAIGWTPPPPGAPVTPAQYLAELVNLTTGELDSITDGMHPVDAIIWTQLRTMINSGAAVTDAGNAFASIQYNSLSAPGAILLQIHAIFDPLVAAGWVNLIGVDVAAGESYGTLAAAEVQYQNLLQASVDTTKIAVGSTGPRLLA